MLTLWGPGGHTRYCDGRSRRSFLKIGGLAMGGLSLPGLLQAESRGTSRSPSSAAGASHKSVIMIYLSGGLPHQDTFDIKTEAPDGIRGEFKPIATRLPGVQIGEMLPRIAGVMDKVAVIRSIVGLRDEHSSFQNVTGFPMGQSQREGKPSFGSVIARRKARSTRSCRRSSTCSRSCSTSRTTAPGRASWATPTRRRGWKATTWRC